DCAGRFRRAIARAGAPGESGESHGRSIPPGKSRRRSAYPSGVTDAGVLRQKESRKQRVNSQQPFARQSDDFLCSCSQIARRIERIELLAKPLQNVDPVFILEVRGQDRTQLELEHELA